MQTVTQTVSSDQAYHGDGDVYPCLNKGLWALARARPQARAGGTER